MATTAPAATATQARGAQPSNARGSSDDQTTRKLKLKRALQGSARRSITPSERTRVFAASQQMTHAIDLMPCAPLKGAFQLQLSGCLAEARLPPRSAPFFLRPGGNAIRFQLSTCLNRAIVSKTTLVRARLPIGDSYRDWRCRASNSMAGTHFC